MQEPLHDWMYRKNLIDMYQIFQSNGVTLDQVESISTDTLNEMGLNIGQRKRFFSATGRDRSSSSKALPTYGQVLLCILIIDFTDFTFSANDASNDAFYDDGPNDAGSFSTIISSTHHN